ncbi:hypothetical protein RHGRI_028222 [Rhododendron griersonianum]|uniref:Uncharacterized protein n=1 Tax=Rhododendron griersonianum TaxID=479676 RepID=A0AAV6IEZ2_9ERIC|nr:hypothetical protein RHGRI_028222 [Rhododendron griersonianum]
MKGQDSIAQTKPVDDSCRRTKVFAIPLLLVSGGVYGGVNEDISIFRRRRIGFLSHRTKSVRALSYGTAAKTLGPYSIKYCISPIFNHLLLFVELLE